MIKAENADKLGEFSPDRQKIFPESPSLWAKLFTTRTPADRTAIFHIALGSSYHDAFDGDMSGKS